MKNYADTTPVDLSEYDIHLVLGGEMISEGLRTYLLTHFSSVRSSFGASDLEINIGVETAFTIALRQRCMENRVLCEALFGKPTPPMIFQYNPADYYIETNTEGELIFTIARLANIAPKVRYNLRDAGGSISIKQLTTTLDAEGISINDLGTMQSATPLLYVYGRSDMTISFYGANLYPSDIDELINRDTELAQTYNSFQLRVEERGENLRPTLIISLEQSESGRALQHEPKELSRRFAENLSEINQDFREVRKMFDADQVVVEIDDYGTGRFAHRDIRIKSQYIGAQQ